MCGDNSVVGPPVHWGMFSNMPGLHPRDAKCRNPRGSQIENHWSIVSITNYRSVILDAKLCLTLLQPHGLLPTRLLHPWDFPGKNTRVGYHFLLQGIFPTQGSNLCLQHWQADFFSLSHQGSLWNWGLLPKATRVTSWEAKLLQPQQPSDA